MEASRGAVINDLATALSQAGTRTDVRKRLLLAFLGTVLGAGLLTVFAASLTRAMNEQDDLVAHGSSATGVIRSVDNGYGLSDDGRAEVAYEVAGRRYVERVDLGSDYVLGQHIRVYYDRDDPSRMATKDGDSTPEVRLWMACILIVAGLVCLTWGGLGLYAWARCRRDLARYPWRSVHLDLHVDGSNVLADVTDGTTVYVCRGMRTTLPPLMWMFRRRPAGQALAVGPVGKLLYVADTQGRNVVQLLAWTADATKDEGITSAG